MSMFQFNEWEQVKKLIEQTGKVCDLFISVAQSSQVHSWQKRSEAISANDYGGLEVLPVSYNK